MPFLAECLGCGHAEPSESNSLYRAIFEGRARHLLTDNGRVVCFASIGLRGLKQFPTVCDASETCVVWEHPVTGEVRYPGRNDAKMPVVYQREGFQKKTMRSLHEIQRFEKQHGVLNERAWYDKGSGKDFG